MRILFVDDEPKILRSLERVMRSRSRDWSFCFAEGGAAALDALSSGPFDVLVTDMRMPGVDGLALLQHVRERYPQMMRVVLSGYTEREETLRAASLAHQFLRKPCDPESLEGAIRRLIELQRLLTHPEVRATLSKLDGLPSLPSLCQELEDRIASPKVEPREIVSLIERDIGMQAKLLQVVNSPLFGVSRRVTSLLEAVHLLGLSAMRELVLVAKAFKSFTPPSPPPDFSLEEFHRHSLLVGSVASALLPDPRLASEAFAAGTLHDVGQLVLAHHLPERLSEDLRQAKRSGRSLYEVEISRDAATHAALGGALFSLWGLPYPLVEAVARHHDASVVRHSEFGILDAVYIARMLVDEVEAGIKLIERDTPYLDRLGATERVPRWRELARSRGEAALAGRLAPLAPWGAHP
jgi:HD-like signal output (HDOD) protein